MQLRRVMVGAIQWGDQEVKELAIKVLMRFGIVRASAEDLLLALQLQAKYKVDCASELEAFCKQSEEFKPPMILSGGQELSYEYHNECQSRMTHNKGGDEAKETDQCVSDGNHYFLYSLNRGFTRGKKTPSTGVWEWL